MVLKPGREAEAEAIFRKWELDFAVIGRVTDTGHMVLQVQRRGRRRHSARAARRRSALLRASLACRTPKRRDAARRGAGRRAISATICWLDGARPISPAGAGSGSNMTTWSAPTPSSARAATPPSCASTAPTRASRSATDCTPRYCFADPVEGGKQAIAECYRNLSAVGAMPLAVTDCMNFGNPQRPEIMGQFVGCIEGMADGLRGARHADRVGQRLALQRDQGRGRQRQRDPADAGDRRHRPARRLERDRRRSPSRPRARRSW